MFNVRPQLRPYSRSSAGSDSLETSSINGFTLSDELIAFYQATDGLNLSQLDTDVLTLEAASAYARDLDYHPLSQAVGLWPITDSNDSNPYCVCLNQSLRGAVLRLSHDGSTRISHHSLSAFLSSIEELVANGAESIDDCNHEFPLDTNLMASADCLLSDVLHQQTFDEAVIVPLLSACSPASIASCLTAENMWVREEAALLLGKHVHLPSREALIALSKAGTDQDNVAAKKSLSIINRAFFAQRGS